jgi:hypothetical protein
MTDHIVTGVKIEDGSMEFFCCYFTLKGIDGHAHLKLEDAHACLLLYCQAKDNGLSDDQFLAACSTVEDGRIN